MAISCPTTITEIIWYALVVIVGAVFFELRWAIHKLITKIEELPEKYTTKEYMNKWEKGRGPLWDAINHHSHKGIEGTGEVIKK